MIRTYALLLVVLATGVLSAQPPREASDAALLPVSRVVLYKTGIGFFEHRATVDGNQSLAVPFTGDQLDDVLKSLTAVDLGEGRVTGISFDSPTPAERRLQALRVPLEPDADALAVIRALRGSRVDVRQAGGIVSGRLLHAERRPATSGETATERDFVTVMTDAGDLSTVELDPGTRLRLADADIRQDLGRYLDVAATHGDRSPRRVVISTIGTGRRQVLVSYVGEAAVWKTTYRLIFPAAGERQPLLQGWAIVDNVSAADWDDVELSLVAGAPQAFRQPLSAPLFATRPVVPLAAGAGLSPQVHAGALAGGAARVTGLVRDENGSALPGATVTVTNAGGQPIARIVSDSAGRYDVAGLPAGVVGLRAELAGFSPVNVPALALTPGGTTERDVTLVVGTMTETVTVTAASPAFRAGGGTGGGAFRPGSPRPAPSPPPPPAMPARGEVERRIIEQPIAAAGADLGDLFEYKLADRVTIRRNQSALVPILQTPVAAERISLWNDAMGARPRRAVWLTNTSALTLDAGSLSVVDGAFAGEGLVEPIAPGARRLVSYAADLGVQVSARSGDSPGRVLRIRVARGLVTEDTETRRRRTYVIRNDDRDARTVVVEHPTQAGWSLPETLKADESTAAVHRFRVSLDPGQTRTLDVDEVRAGATTYAVDQIDRERLLLITASGSARSAIEQALAPLAAKGAELDTLEADLERIDGDVERITADQARIRENLTALKGSSTERRLVERYARQLDEQETRLDTLRQERAAVAERQARAEREMTDLMAALSLDVVP